MIMVQGDALVLASVMLKPWKRLRDETIPSLAHDLVCYGIMTISKLGEYGLLL